MKHLFLMVTVALLLVSCGDPGPECTTSDQCDPGFVCYNEFCVASGGQVDSDTHSTLPDSDKSTIPDNDENTESDTYLSDEDGDFLAFDGDQLEIPDGDSDLPSDEDATELDEDATELDEDAAQLDEDAFVYPDDDSLPCSAYPDNPDEGFTDSNCDGIDGDIKKAIFVDITGGFDGNSGSQLMPLASIQAAIDMLKITPAKEYILVAEGDYYSNDSIVLEDNVKIYGGYQHSTWARSTSWMATVHGPPEGVLTCENKHDIVVHHINMMSDHAGGGKSSVVVLLNGCFRLSFVLGEYRSGNGGSGNGGNSGTPGIGGNIGYVGAEGCEDDSSWYCSSCSRPSGGTGAASSCEALGGLGGLPGFQDVDGEAGKGAPKPSGGTYSNGGIGSGRDKDTSCLAAKQIGWVSNGGNGTPGVVGAGGYGGLEVGTFAGSVYTPADAHDGEDGRSGGGGGGGGGGRGGNDYCDSYGSAGGGGGSGGCGGTGGQGGTGGGGSFVFYIVNGSTITFDRLTIKSGNGGTGGDGGLGGTGATGGLGAKSGDWNSNGEQGDAGCGGWGGDGGLGGAGGYGGGGGGGPSIGIVRLNSTILSASSIQPGSGGNGGVGGDPTKNGAVGLSEREYTVK